MDIVTKIKAVLTGAWKSKTIWFNTLVGSLLAAEAAFPLLHGLISDFWYGVILFTLTIGNVILRGVTNKALADK